jgi:hypothetical protein
MRQKLTLGSEPKADLQAGDGSYNAKCPFLSTEPMTAFHESRPFRVVGSSTPDDDPSTNGENALVDAAI